MENTLSNTHSDHPDAAMHFNLGVDRLASDSEIIEMHDPWLSQAGPSPVEHVEAGVHMPEGDFQALANPSQLPGV